jgi:hypothetical protein
MAVFALTAAYVSIAANVLSDHGTSAELAIEVDDLDATNFASGGWKEHLGGLKDGKITINFNQDMAAGAIDSIMWPLLGTVVAFELRATSSAVGTSNPKFTGNLLVTGWTPISGKVGDLAQASVTYPTTAVVTRATS